VDLIIIKNAPAAAAAHSNSKATGGDVRDHRRRTEENK
jgi:hypothetical protein